MVNKKYQQGHFAEKHGLINEVFCQHFASEIVEQLMRHTTKGNAENQIKTTKELKNAKMVKILVYEGKTTRVFCHLLRNGICTSNLRNLSGEPCILK